MDFTAVARTTFSCRDFTDQSVADSTIYELLDTARFASSGGNRQGWRVIVVRDPDTKAALAELSSAPAALYAAQRAAGESPWNTITPTSLDVEAELKKRGHPAFTNVFRAAPVVLIMAVDLGVVASMDRYLDRIGVISGASIYPFVWNFLLAANNAGLGGALTTFLAHSEPAAQQLLGLPSSHAVAAVVPLGYPVKRLTKLTRKPVESFATLERYDGAPLTSGSA